MDFNCLMSYIKIEKTEGAKLPRKKDILMIKLFCRMQEGACEIDIIFFPFKAFYSNIGKLSDNHAGV